MSGGAASPRTDAGKSLVYYGEAMDDRLNADFGIPKAMRLILTESVLRIEAEAAQQAEQAFPDLDGWAKGFKAGWAAGRTEGNR